MRRILYTLLTVLALQLALAAVASASVQLSATTLVAGENQGQATVTVLRTGALSGVEHVYYGTHKLDSTPGIDYLNVGGLLVLGPGQQTATFTIPIIPHDWSGPAAHVAVYLYGSWPESLGQNNATLTIVHDAQLASRDPKNPLELSPPPTDGNLLAGARFYADRVSSPAAKPCSRTPTRATRRRCRSSPTSPGPTASAPGTAPTPARRCSPTCARLSWPTPRPCR